MGKEYYQSSIEKMVISQEHKMSIDLLIFEYCNCCKKFNHQETITKPIYLFNEFLMKNDVIFDDDKENLLFKNPFSITWDNDEANLFKSFFDKTKMKDNFILYTEDNTFKNETVYNDSFLFSEIIDGNYIVNFFKDDEKYYMRSYFVTRDKNKPYYVDYLITPNLNGRVSLERM